MFVKSAIVMLLPLSQLHCGTKYCTIKDGSKMLVKDGEKWTHYDNENKSLKAECKEEVECDGETTTKTWNDIQKVCTSSPSP